MRVENVLMEKKTVRAVDSSGILTLGHCSDIYEKPGTHIRPGLCMFAAPIRQAVER